MSMDKIANYYYNLGAQHAHSRMSGGMRKTAAPSGKALAKALGVGGAAALSPAALNELGMLAGKGGLGGATGIMESAALRNLLTGNLEGAGAAARSLPGMIGQDAAALRGALDEGLARTGLDGGIMNAIRRTGMPEEITSVGAYGPDSFYQKLNAQVEADRGILDKIYGLFGG